VSSIEKILSRDMKLINSCSCPKLSTFHCTQGRIKLMWCPGQNRDCEAP